MLKSWAVPKGPSVDPDDKRLAMHVEDHPLDYGGFEGTIPKGEYGGGTVMLWDRGRWIPEPGKDPKKTIEEGHLHFTLEGERMKGEWVMFRLKGREGERGEPWMLKKVDRRIRRRGRRRRAGRYARHQRHDRPDDGRNRRRAATSGESNRGGAKGGRAKKQARARSRRHSARRSSRPWSMRCRPGPTGSTNINMTATGC